MKRDFLEAYRAGGQAVERDLKGDWKTVVIFVVAIGSSILVEKWLAVRYSLSWYVSSMLSTIAMVAVVAALLALRRRLHI